MGSGMYINDKTVALIQEWIDNHATAEKVKDHFKELGFRKRGTPPGTNRTIVTTPKLEHKPEEPSDKEKMIILLSYYDSDPKKFFLNERSKRFCIEHQDDPLTSEPQFKWLKGLWEELQDRLASFQTTS